MAKRRNKKVREEEIVEEAVQGTVVTDNTTAWFERNKSIVLASLGLLVLLLGGYLFYKYSIQEPKANEAIAAIYKAQQQFERDSFELALENPGGGFDGFLDIVENYSGTSTANAAKLYAGISYLNIGRYEDAITYLESHNPVGDYSPIIKNGNLGDAYSELGQMDKAINFYSKATTASEDALLTPYYLYKLALLARRNGDNGKALEAFKRIKEEYPTSNESTNIDMLIQSVS